MERSKASRKPDLKVDNISQDEFFQSLSSPVSRQSKNIEELEGYEAEFVKLGFQKESGGKSNNRVSGALGGPIGRQFASPQKVPATGAKTREQIEEEMMRELMQIQDEVAAETTSTPSPQGKGHRKPSTIKQKGPSGRPQRYNQAQQMKADISMVSQEEKMEVDEKSDKSAQQKLESPIKPFEQASILEGQIVGAQQAISSPKHKRMHTFRTLDMLIAQEKTTVNQSPEEEDLESDYGTSSRGESRGTNGNGNRFSNNQDQFSMGNSSGEIEVERADIAIFITEDRRGGQLEEDALRMSHISRTWGSMVQNAQNVDQGILEEVKNPEEKLEDERAMFNRNQQQQANDLKQFERAQQAIAFYRQIDDAPAFKGAVNSKQSRSVSLCRDLLHYLISGSYRIHSLVKSDFELAKTTHVLRTFSSHEGHFNLGRNLFYTHDYEGAKEQLLKALKFKPDDTACSIWLGVTNLFQGKQIESRLNHLPNKVDSTYRTLSAQRDKVYSECVKVLGKCRKKKEESIFANFGLLMLSFICQEQFPPLIIPKLKKAEDYATSIKQHDEYLGYVAWALTYIKLKGPDKHELGQSVLEELITMNPSLPEAYIAMWNIDYSVKHNFASALNIAEQLFMCATDYQSIQEKIMMTCIYAKSLNRAGEYYKAFTLLQLEYSKSPQYTSLLYLYGKYTVASQMKEFFGSAIGALDECLRQCLPHRHQNVKYYIGLAYEQLNRKLLSYTYYQQYLLQTSTVQEQIISKVDQVALFVNQFDSNYFSKVGTIYREILSTKQLTRERISILSRDNLYRLYQKIYESDHYEANLFKAIFEYKIFQQNQKADDLFQLIISETKGNCVEAYLEYIKFLKRQGNIHGASTLGKTLLQKVDSEQVSTTLWVQAHIEVAKVEHQNKQIDVAVELLLKLRQVLPPIDISQVADFKLPFNMEDYQQRPLYDRAQHQFQEELYPIDENADDDEASRSQIMRASQKKVSKADDDFEFESSSLHQRVSDAQQKQIHQSFLTDGEEEELKSVTSVRQETTPNKDTDYNRMVMTETNVREEFSGRKGNRQLQSYTEESTFMKAKTQKSPINQTPEGRSLSNFFGRMYKSPTIDFKSQGGMNQSQVIFYGNTPDGNEVMNNRFRTNSLRSSMPKIAVMQFLQNRQGSQIGNVSQFSPGVPDESQYERNLELEAINEYMKDTNFSVYSDPKFLYIIGKICARSQLLIYADLAIQSFHDYLLFMTYYRSTSSLDDSKYSRVKLKTYIWIARVLLNAEQYEDCEKILNSIYLECMECPLKDEFQEEFCKLNRAKGGLMRQNLIVDHFYRQYFKPASERHLNDRVVKK